MINTVNATRMMAPSKSPNTSVVAANLVSCNNDVGSTGAVLLLPPADNDSDSDEELLSSTLFPSSSYESYSSTDGVACCPKRVASVVRDGTND